MVAITLGILTNLHAARQFRESRRATVLSHRPILVPVHEAGWLSKLDAEDHWFPAEREYKTGDARPALQNEVFRVARRSGVPHASLALRNVGQGPALVRRIVVWDATGSSGELTGQAAVAAGGTSTFVVPLGSQTGADGYALAGERWSPQSLPDALLTRRDVSANKNPAVHFLEVEFDDIFDNPSGSFRLRAWFDPRDFGSWQVISDPSEWIPTSPQSK